MGYDVRRRPGAWPLEQATRRAQVFWAGVGIVGVANLLFFALTLARW